ncbi:hypothetical protein T265_11105 [Opisthorchis viverrini]|uniref:Zinc finger, C4 type n=1 Tax=Opisthorchis viverrini TaxID=6198 RepID=A0A074YZV3_OPIVI|nr:hypothetical protein T265_11105 [Opisthorchis viverrini]KER20321.1 hypothetical protein T265_11105 [Opisthorchis viverrini]
MEGVLKAPPDSTNSDLAGPQEMNDTDSASAMQSNNSVSTSPTSKCLPFRDPYLPEDDGTILTPEHAFVQYQTRSEDQACQICGQPAVGFHHRAYVCEACKKFFMRHTAARYRHAEAGGGNLSDSACPMGGQCRVEGPGRGKCPHCRYRKCLDLGMTLTPPGGESGCDISQIPCRVCGGPSSGFHFGALTCEGCKGFFRRTVLSNVRLECLSNNDCPITPANRNMCKSCRFQRCLAVGMSKSGSRIGRQPNAIKYYCAREISQLTSSSGESDANQPSSSVPSMSNGRSLQTSRQRADSASSDGEKLGRSSSHPRPPSWITDRSIQPAHSSTDQASSALLSIHLPQSQNGQLPSLNSPIKSFTPTKRADGNFASGGGPRRFSADSIQPPDSSPKSVPGQKRRKVSADRYPTGNNAAGVVYVDGSSMTFSPQCDPDSERVRYASSSSPSMAFRDSHACQLHELSSSRVSREWVSSNESLHERARRPYDLPIDQLSHGSTTPLEYSLPNPDTSTHISSTTSIHEHDDLLVPSPGKLLVPLAVHLPLDESGTEELQMQYKVISANDVLQQQQPQRSDSASSTFTNNTYGTLLRDPGASTAALHFQSQQSSYRAQVVVPDSSPRRVSPLPSSNLSTSTPPSSNLPIRLNADEVQQLTQRAGAVSRSSRSVVDNLTSTVLQYRQHQHQQRLLADSGIKMDSGMTTIHIPCSSPSELHQSRTQSYGRLSSGSLPQPSKHSPVPSHPDVPYPSCSSSSPPTRIPIPSNHPSYPLSTSSGKPTSPELSWHPTKHQQQRTGRGVHNNGSANAAAAATELQFRAGCLPSKFELSPVSTYLNGNSNEPSLCPVDVTATSSASWFAAAAAAAAVANALMAASQAPSSSEISASDSYTAISSKLSHSRLKTESPLSSSGSPAVLVAAAAAAATAAEFVLSNRRVRGALPSEDFHHRSSSSAGGIGGATGFPVYSSPGTSSPSPPLGAFSRAASIIAATTAEALCAERASQLCMDYNLAGFGSSIRSAAATSSNSMEPTPSVNLQVTSKETHTTGIRSRNGLRATSVTVHEFSEGIHKAAKYLLSERKKIRSNVLPQCRPMHTLERDEEVWDRMMQNFEFHARFVVHFVKLIPGFDQLELGDKRQLVRGAMYPLMLLELSRDFVNGEVVHFNYFDFTESEREVIHKHFPTFRAMVVHLVRSGKLLDDIRLDSVELALVCAQEVFKHYHGLIDPPATEHLYNLASRALTDYIITTGQPVEGTTLLRHLSSLLEELNIEHHQVIAQLRHDKPELDFPELYTEMFQLTEAEEAEAAMAGGPPMSTEPTH